MKNTILFFVLGCSIFSGFDAKAQNWKWVKGAHGGESEGYYCATDVSGNVYATGLHWGPSYFGTDTLATGGVFIVKYDSVGNLKWAITSHSAVGSTCAIAGLTTDLFGNEYLIGIYDTTISLGSFTLMPPGPHNFYYFIAKIDSSGSVEWMKNIGDLASYDFEEGERLITTDIDGNVFVACGFTNNASIGSFNLTNVASNNTSDVFVGKFDSSGNVIWVKSYGGRKADFATGICVTNLNNIYITGNFTEDSVVFGSTVITDTSTVLNHTNAFIVKLNSSGLPLWAEQSFGGGTCFISGAISSDSAEDVYISGAYYDGQVILDTSSLVIPPVNKDYGFLAKLNSTGNIVWVKEMQGDFIWPYSASLDPCGNIWISASLVYGGGIDTIDDHIVNSPFVSAPSGSNDPMLIAGWSSSGNYLQAFPLSSGGDDRNSIAIDKCGNIFIEGDYEVDTFTLGASTLYGTGAEDNFVAKYNPNLGCGNCEGNELIQKVPAQAYEVTLYPNPAYNECTIDYSGALCVGAKVAIYDLAGRLIHTYPLFKSNTTISVADLSPGMYQCRIDMNGYDVVTKKLTVLR